LAKANGLVTAARHVAAGSDDQAFAAFGATTGQHFAAIGSCHASAETVDALALEIARLERSFHGGDFRYLICGQIGEGGSNGRRFGEPVKGRAIL
jgi:hypothetical protein